MLNCNLRDAGQESEQIAILCKTQYTLDDRMGSMPPLQTPFTNLISSDIVIDHLFISNFDNRNVQRVKYCYKGVIKFGEVYWYLPFTPKTTNS